MTVVHFAIPIAGRREPAQWGRLNDLLKQTLLSILNQSDDRYLIYVCGHDRPEILNDGAFASVKFIAVDFPPPKNDRERRRDKRRKRWEIARAVRDAGGGYFMYMDADDLVHKDLVKFIADDDNKVGYRIERGYALDYANRCVAPIPGAFSLDYDRVCGSSGAVYMLPDDLPSQPFGKSPDDILYCRVSNHKFFREGVARDGQTLAAVPFPAGIYTLNNSLNLSDVLVRSADRQAALIDSIREAAIQDVAEISLAFGLGGFLGPAPSKSATALKATASPMIAADRPAPKSESPPRGSKSKKPGIATTSEALEALRPHALPMAALLEYAESTGWLDSVRTRRPVDRFGEAIPWYTFPAIEFLAPRIGADFRVFEFGSGNSTKWWAARAESVLAVEHDTGWASIVGQSLPGNVRLITQPLTYDGEYCRSASASGEAFDVVVVDGRDRINCSKYSLSALSERGVIIWDNTERRRYHPGFDFLYENGFKRLEFRGLAPIRGIPLETSVFYRTNNCLGI